ncbi:MAG: Ig-like domain-containing protein, partial [Clostridia bacterium]|nr:Ig-like domain-containing protein [Clostridia bacterium]
MNRIFRSVLVLALIMCAIMAYTLVASASDDAIIYTAEDISSDGRIVTTVPDEMNGKILGGNVKGAYSNGMVRFVSTNPGAASTTGDRLIVAVDNINLTEYPYVAISYNTNIDAPNLNFNLTTAGGSYTREAKIFFAQTRTSGKKSVGTGKYDGAYGMSAVATSVYVPLWSNTGKVAGADEYFDVEYIGFFKTEDAMKSYKYTPGEIKVNIQLVEQVQRLIVGDSFKLTATTVIEGQTMPTVTFESDNDAVASVTADGTVTA